MTEKEGETHGEIFNILVHSPNTSNSWAASGQSQGFATLPGPPTWVTGTQAPGSVPVAFPGVSAGSRIEHLNRQVSQAVAYYTGSYQQLPSNF